MRQPRKSKLASKARKKKSSVGLVAVLTVCLICGVAFGFWYGGVQGNRIVTSLQQDISYHNSRLDTKTEQTITQEQTQASASTASLLPSPTAGTGEISHVENNEKKIALTFDAGASAEPVADLLAVLNSYNLRVTFFLTGKWCDKFPEAVKNIADAGHELANHTYNHKDLTKLDNAAIKEELEKMADALKIITGTPPAALARPPFGARDKRVLEQIRTNNYIPIYWSLDSLDSVKKDITAQYIRDRVLNRVKDGDIILMHCGSRPTADALDELIGKLIDRGYVIVSVSELINSKK